MRFSSVLSDYCADIATAYALGAPRSDLMPSGRGEQGRVWRLDTEIGSYAVKELMGRQIEIEAAEDVAYQEAVLAAGSVRLPCPVRTEQGRVLTEYGPHQLRVYEWLELLPVDPTQDPGLIGRTYAAVHRVRHESARPLLPWYTDPVGLTRWNALLEASRAASAPFAGELAAEIPFLVQLEGLLEPPTDLRMCHRDLWSDNLPPAAEGGVCVIDWESCGLAGQAQELPMALFDFCFGDQGRTVELYGGYLAAGGPARLRRRADFTMVIAQFGHFWEKALTTYLAPGASAEAKAHSLDRIEEAVSASLRIEHIDAMLDWTAAVH